MNKLTDITKKNEIEESNKLSRIQTIIVSLEVVFVVALLVVWLCSESIQQSKNLWVLFFYNFPSQFLIAVVPHEPVFLYFSKYYAPLFVTAVGIAGTLITEILNYSVFGFFSELKVIKKVSNSKFVQRLLDLFQKAPFLALWIAGFTPVPFYPFRFIAVLSDYPKQKYILAIFLSRTPRFFLLAYIGYTINLPTYLLAIIFLIITVLIYVPLIRELIRNKRGKSE